ncbi:ABC transporter, ATP-binding protein [Eubacterium nodatum ATCC 33099]|nr:ABC transporter, ATP-binding protein [Eubacterium nodatum ATCC 33099]
MVNNVRMGTCPVMEVRGVNFSYGKNQILRELDLIIKEKSITTIMGANGCGKSTLFSLMTKNLEPDSGRVFIRGRNLKNISLKDFATKVAIVQQYNDAPGDITVRQLVSFGRTPHITFLGEGEKEDEEKIAWAMEVTGISEYSEREISRLSGGQKQRAWIAMALAQDTKILFLDEPTTYLDVRYQVEILELIKSLNENFGLTIIMVLHDINQALHYSDEIIGLHQGRVKVEGRPSDAINKESISLLYGIDLDVMEINGKKVVLPLKREKQVLYDG